MIKTLNINLGGMAFIIDENAFELLHNYLEALKRKFVNASEREEILNDIEARIAEMLSAKLAGRKEVVSLDDVQQVINAMGRPEDIAGEETAEETKATGQAGSSSSTGPSATTVKRRLFRDPDDSKIGGVISGLCHYFGINDPTWVRIAALILIFISSGTAILVYLLLMVVIPKANTAAEKLQMKGEPVNISTIEKEIKDAASRAQDSVHRMVKDENFFERLWDIVLSIFKVILRLFAVLDIGIALICLFVVGLCFVVFYILGSTPYNSVSRLITDSSSTLTYFSFGFLLFFAAPLIGLFYVGLRILVGNRSQVRWLRPALVLLWLAGLVLLGITGYKVGVNYRTGSTVSHTLPIVQAPHGTLYVQLVDSSGRKFNGSKEDKDNYIKMDEDGLFINGVNFKDIEHIELGHPSLQIMPSENDSFYLQEVITARGRNRGDADKNADMVIYSFSEADSFLNLPANIYIGKNSKYRCQQMKLRIAIPEGKKIHFADNMDTWAATVKGNSDYDDTYFNGTLWTVENGKVKCIDGENHKNATETEKPAHKTSKHKKDADEDESSDKDKDHDNEDY